MSQNPLASLAEYSRFVAEWLDRPTVVRSTVFVWSDSPFTGIGEGEVFFSNGIRLRMREELDFDAALIASYGYEVYRGPERLFWYDDYPHPEDASLASTFPHHKHIPPEYDITAFLRHTSLSAARIFPPLSLKLRRCKRSVLRASSEE